MTSNQYSDTQQWYNYQYYPSFKIIVDPTNAFDELFTVNSYNWLDRNYNLQ